jgi:hypothetical protein
MISVNCGLIVDKSVDKLVWCFNHRKVNLFFMFMLR